MKSSTHAGFEQDYNAQVAVDQRSLLIVGCTLSNHPNDSQEAEPTLDAILSEIGTPEAAAMDAGYFGPTTLVACTKRGIEPYIATGRDLHHPSWQQRFAPLPDPPSEDASAQINSISGGKLRAVSCGCFRGLEAKKLTMPCSSNVSALRSRLVRGSPVSCAR